MPAFVFMTWDKGLSIATLSVGLKNGIAENVNKTSPSTLVDSTKYSNIQSCMDGKPDS